MSFVKEKIEMQIPFVDCPIVQQQQEQTKRKLICVFSVFSQLLKTEEEGGRKEEGSCAESFWASG